MLQREERDNLAALRVQRANTGAVDKFSVPPPYHKANLLTAVSKCQAACYLKPALPRLYLAYAGTRLSFLQAAACNNRSCV